MPDRGTTTQHPATDRHVGRMRGRGELHRNRRRQLARGNDVQLVAGQFAAGITSPTSEHGASFLLQHPVGSPGRILIAEVEVPGCPDVQSAVVFPPADASNCPTQINITVFGSGGALPVPSDGTTYAALPPGDYRVRVTAPPVGQDVTFEWYRDNTLQSSTPATPNELSVPGLPAGAETVVAVRVQKECCPALLDTVVLRTTPAGGTDPGGNGNNGGTTTPPQNPPVTTPPVVVGPPAWPCLILGLLVGLAIIAALLSLVALAVPAVSIIALPALAAAAIAILIAGILLLLICQPSLCRLLGIICVGTEVVNRAGSLDCNRRPKPGSISVGALLRHAGCGRGVATGVEWLPRANVAIDTLKRRSGVFAEAREDARNASPAQSTDNPDRRPRSAAPGSPASCRSAAP